MKTRSQTKSKEAINSHPTGWEKTTHYGQCGQSCPCCRANVEDVPFGVCLICWKKRYNITVN